MEHACSTGIGRCLFSYSDTCFLSKTARRALTQQKELTFVFFLHETAPASLGLSRTAPSLPSRWESWPAMILLRRCDPVATGLLSARGLLAWPSMMILRSTRGRKEIHAQRKKRRCELATFSSWGRSVNPPLHSTKQPAEARGRDTIRYDHSRISADGVRFTVGSRQNIRCSCNCAASCGLCYTYAYGFDSTRYDS